MKNPIKVTTLIPITERFDPVKELYFDYKSSLEDIGYDFEIIYIIDGDYPTVLSELTELKKEGENIKIIKLARWFGEATAITVGFDNSDGDMILTLPAYRQVDSSELSKLFSKINDHDMVIAQRARNNDSLFNKLQSSLFHFPIKYFTKVEFHDLGCGVRLFKRKVLEELSLYGDQHRFLPLLAYRQGFKIVEVNISQAQTDKKIKIYMPGIYLRRFLDIVSAFFLFKFTKKPLRFFGLFGSTVLGIGMILFLYIIIERFFFNIPLSERPMLLVSTLSILLGIQLFAIGLIGEIIIFTHAKELKEYTIEKIIN